MRNNETGEFELVVGNKFLLSGFFIVVLLFAVAFAMGYVVGENSRPGKGQAQTPPVTTNTTAASDVRPQPAPAPSVPAEAPSPAKAADPDQPPKADSSEPTTQPARTTEAAAAAAPPPTPTPASRAAVADEPAPGSYWQVMALANKDTAQTLVQTLKDKGFPALTSAGTNNLTRVLVGPYNDTASMGRAKTELENAGFLHLGSYKK